VDIQVRNRNYAGAASTCDQGVRIARAVKADALAFGFLVKKGEVLEAQDKLADAESVYKQVATEAASASGTAAEKEKSKLLADVALGRIAAKRGEGARARTLIEAALKSDESTVLGPAYAAMGIALFNAGVKEQSVDKLREAVYDNFLRTIVAHAPGPADSTAAIEEAYHGAFQACLQLAQLEGKQKEQAEFWTEQARLLGNDFVGRYGGSRFAADVRGKIPK
jgi:hypothetical protein